MKKRKCFLCGKKVWKTSRLCRECFTNKKTKMKGQLSRVLNQKRYKDKKRRESTENTDKK